MMHDITDEEWKHIQKQRERSEQFKKEVDECHALLKEKMKNFPTDMLECKFYTTDKMPEVVRAALLTEICRRKREDKWKDMSTDLLTCKYYTDDDYIKTLSDDERIAMFKEICLRRKEELKYEQPLNS